MDRQPSRLAEASRRGAVEGSRVERIRGAVVVALFIACLAFGAPAAGARSTANPTLNVMFFVNGAITVTLSDGTPVGASGATPTVIPAGYYTVLLSGPSGCAEMPYFTLKGPGENIASNLQDGEITSTGYNADFLPGTTYTWTNASMPGTTYAFTTSNVVVGSSVPTNPGTTTLPGSRPVSSHDLVGSAVATFRGTLSGTVNPAGGVALSYRGKAVASLKAGRYTVAVTDRSTTNGLTLAKGMKRTPKRLSGAAFVGKRSASVVLTAGQWIFAAKSGRSIAVR